MLVSCVMATGRRGKLLRQAIKYFHRQTYPDKELIVVDDGDEPNEGISAPGITYLHLPERYPIGKKLNIGIKAASGEVIQKLDDDDWYGPIFLERMMRRLTEKEWRRSIAAQTGFLVFFPACDRLYFSGYGTFSGATIGFAKKLWEEKPFREDVEANEDNYFRCDHSYRFAPISDLDVFAAFRHGHGHIMKKICGVAADDYFIARPYRKSIESIMPAEDIAFYRSLGGVVK